MTQADHRRSQAAAGIHRISRLGMVNEYLVAEDDGLTLIDTGLAGTHRLILARARDLGMPIRRIALTHAHRDHRGSLDALAAAVPGVQVIVSEREAPLLAGDTQPHDDEPEGELRGGENGNVPLLRRLDRDGGPHERTYTNRVSRCKAAVRHCPLPRKSARDPSWPGPPALLVRCAIVAPSP